MAEPIANSNVAPPNTFDDYVKRLGLKTFLSAEDARTYSADLSHLVGNYFQVDDKGNAELLGRPDDIPSAASIQLKDKIEYRALLEDGSSISATLPWLSSVFKAQTKTSITIQDIASVIGTSDPAMITKNFPVGAASPGKDVWFLAAATVTVISATQYANKSITGSTIIQVGGDKLHVLDVLQNAWVISINKVRAIAPVGNTPGPSAKAKPSERKMLKLVLPRQ